MFNTFSWFVLSYIGEKIEPSKLYKTLNEVVYEARCDDPSTSNPYTGIISIKST